MLSLALLNPAFALVIDEACMGYFVSDSVPRPAATEVPMDVVPAVILRADGCGAPMEMALELYRVEDTESTLIGSSTAQLSGDAVELAAYAGETGLLEPETNYLLRVVATEGLGEASAIGFTTGTETLAGTDGVPQLRMRTIDANKFDGVWWLSASSLIEPAEDPDLLSIVTVAAEGDEALLDALVVDSVGLTSSSISFAVEDVPEQLCLAAEQFDGAHRPSGPSEADCLEVDKHPRLPGDCSAAGGAAGLLPALLALLSSRRR